MQKIDLNVPYLGDRDYVHGTDMYRCISDQLEEKAPEITRFRMRISKIVRCQLDLLLPQMNETPAKPDGAAVEFSYNTKIGLHTGWLVENGRAVSERIDYDENKIANIAQLNDKRICLSEYSGHSPIRTAVSLTKYLHNQILDISEGKWMFTALDIRRLFTPKDVTNMCICFEHRLGNRLTKSNIQCSDETIGEIFFSPVKI